MKAREAGDLVAGRFVLERKIGEGGSGVVWAASSGQDRVALKFLKPSSSHVKGKALAGAFRRFFREARAASSIVHPNVVRVLDILRLEDGYPAIAMELLEGESLDKRLARERTIPPGAARSLFTEVAAALGAAHALGIIHRDLKPQNVFLTVKGEVKVLDFGVAKLTATEGPAARTMDFAGTTTGALGTPFYMAPEQLAGERDIDHRVDVWSLGIVMYEALSGILPTMADNVAAILERIVTRPIWPLEEAAPEVPEDLARLVNRMVAGEKEDRPGSMREIEEELRG